MMNRRSFFATLLSAAVGPPALSAIRRGAAKPVCPSCGRAACPHANTQFCELDRQYRSGFFSPPPLYFHPRAFAAHPRHLDWSIGQDPERW
jgi:hypothetical protein